MTPDIKARADRARAAFKVIDAELRISMDRLRQTMQTTNQSPWPMQVPAFRPRLVVRDPFADAVQSAVDRCKDSSDYRVCLSEFIFKLVDDGWQQSDANQVTKPALEKIREHRTKF